jgi:hypothetical protein
MSRMAPPYAMTVHNERPSFVHSITRPSSVPTQATAGQFESSQSR